MRRPPTGQQKSRRSRRLNWSLFYLLLAAVLAVTLVKISRPLRVIAGQHRELARLQAEKARLTAEMARLEEYQRSLATDRGLERAARREGYVRPGERRLVFVPERPDAKKDEIPSAEE